MSCGPDRIFREAMAKLNARLDAIEKRLEALEQPEKPEKPPKEKDK